MLKYADFPPFCRDKWICRGSGKWCQKRTRILLNFMWYYSNIGDVVFTKARRKARISMWSRGSSPMQGLESSENG